VRFADDFVVSFQFRQDADHFQQRVRERFAEFGLELAEEKTRRILFGRFAGMTCLRHGLRRPETFEFLGFKHVRGVDRRGRFALIRIPSAKSCRKFLARTREWILHNRHWRRWEQQERLTKMLRGFYQYFGLHHCERKLNWVRQQVQRQWISALNRRGQRRRTNWTRLKDRPNCYTRAHPARCGSFTAHRIVAGWEILGNHGKITIRQAQVVRVLCCVVCS
jgi:RNA-directed DNA polymerase